MLELPPALGEAVARSLGSNGVQRGRVALESQDIPPWLPSGGDSLLGVCVQGSWVAESLATLVPDAGFVVFVEDPALGLSLGLSAGLVPDPMRWLDEWQVCGRQLLRLAQLHRNRLLLLDAVEVQREPEAFGRLLSSRFGLKSSTARVPWPDADLQPLSKALGAWLCSARDDVQTLYRELLASCDPLVDGPFGAPPEHDLQVSLAAVRQFYALQSAQRELADAQQQQRLAQAQAVAAWQEESKALHAALDERQEKLALTFKTLAATQASVSELALRADLASQKALHAQGLVEAERLRAAQELSAAEAVFDARCRTLQEALDSAHQAAAEQSERASQGQRQLDRLLDDHAQALGEARADSEQMTELQAALDSARSDVAARAALAAQAQSALHQLQRDDALQQASTRAEMLRLQQALDTALLQHLSTQQERDVAREALGIQHRHAALLLHQLHDVQEALEQSDHRLKKEASRHAAARKEAERLRLALDEAQAQRQASEAQRGAMQDMLDASRKEAADLRQTEAALRQDVVRIRQDLGTLKQSATAYEKQKAGLQADAMSLVKEAAALRKEAAQRSQEAAVSGREAAQAQAALQLSRLELEQVRAALRFLREPGETVIGEVRVLHSRLEPPYRELTVSLRAVQLHAHRVSDATVRLVEHLGHPGIAVFATDGVSPLLQSWRESGREDQRPYMLLVPSDDKSASAFRAMGSDDWRLLLDVTQRLERELRSGPASMRPLWLGLAQRLRAQLLGLPWRMRWAAVDAQAPTGATAEEGWALRFTRLHWGPYQPERVTLRWWPARNGGRLVLLAGDEGSSPLQSWPTDSQGVAHEQLLVPVGSAVRPQDAGKHLPWALLPAVDRAFVAALLARWPDVVDQTALSAMEAHQGGEALQEAANAVQRQALRRLAVPHPGAEWQPPAGLLSRAARHLHLRRRSAAP